MGEVFRLAEITLVCLLKQRTALKPVGFRGSPPARCPPWGGGGGICPRHLATGREHKAPAPPAAALLIQRGQPFLGWAAQWGPGFKPRWKLWGR